MLPTNAFLVDLVNNSALQSLLWKMKVPELDTINRDDDNISCVYILLYILESLFISFLLFGSHSNPGVGWGPSAAVFNPCFTDMSR